ncbi:fimbrial biogenesis chaperone [Pseudomonas sessilinigenes]|uniref:Molecular chaperone n=1 Tax=Pseudomonas sessilinigenes TaxID=658629 RepID=A0ABX8MVI0_9PSED|nr:molecular chaperone [Pseudomonas sessilinigenes]AZC24265.1 Sigma-fimbriae chaperone protein [Pseudomonas sessilinigenes]QXH43218.1 molecular chaperone [Pseudomonas sessilinigenes]
MPRCPLVSSPGHWLLAGLLLLCGQAQAASAVLIWPVNPAIEADQGATALWLENRASQPVTLQVRVLAWTQEQFQDLYRSQQAVIPSPPFVTVEAGRRQLIRLIRLGAVPSVSEQAYRVLIDEVPDGSEPAPKQAGLALQFQMRYSIPLFISGAGIWTQPRADLDRDPASATRPQLAWRLVEEGGQRYLQVRNDGAVHARLSRVRWEGGGRSLPLLDGLLGYVLPGQQMRWLLPPGLAPGKGMSLMLQLSDNDAVVRVPGY